MGFVDAPHLFIGIPFWTIIDRIRYFFGMLSSFSIYRMVIERYVATKNIQNYEKQQNFFVLYIIVPVSIGFSVITSHFVFYCKYSKINNTVVTI